MDAETMGCREGKVGQRKRKMVKLQRASDQTKTQRPQQLVVPLYVHDEIAALSRCQQKAPAQKFAPGLFI